MRLRALLLGALGALFTCLGCRSAGDGPPPLPFELELAFEGEALITEAQLAEIVRAELARLEVTVPDKAAIDDAAFALELFYRERGHDQVRVDYEFEASEPPRARFTIEEGPVVRVREFVIEGPRAIAPERVRTFFEPMASGGIFVATRLEQGRAALRKLYLDREHGHLHVVIERPEVVFDPYAATVAVKLVIREGPAFRVRTVDIDGGVPELAPREAQLARQHTGALFQFSALFELENALDEAYERQGYPDVQVEADAELDDATGEVRVTVEVVPGDRVRIAHFRIVGNERTKDATILNVLGIERGTRYDSELVRAAFRELYATGLFETVTLELEGEGAERTLVIAVVEAHSLQLRMEPGWGSYEGPRLLLGIEENNFGGRGQVVALEATVSLLAQEARVAWIDRDFLGSRFTSETTFFLERREEPSFEFVRRGFGFFVRRNWTQEWSSTAGYEFRPTDVTDESLTAVPTDLETDTNVAALSATMTFDDRDTPLMPTRGGRGLARVEWADDGVGSDTEFVRAQLDYTYLKRLGGESVVAVSLRTGVIAPFGRTDTIPLPERYFNGGENTVRSFKEDELLPPGFDGEPLGGESATTLNLEWRRALGGNLAGAVFLDAGNVSALPLGTNGNFENVLADYVRFDGFRTGVGLGLRYLLPIGPVRVDAAFNPNAESDEDEVVVHISVGFPF